MHVDLVEALRCPRPHDDGWLVVSADEIVDRRIVHGLIGCPQCGTDWPVVHGEVRFGGPAGSADDANDVADADAVPATTNADDGTAVLRLAALLDLRDAQGAVLLAGELARMADALTALTGVLVIAVNAPRGVAARHSRLRVAGAFPLGVGTLRGAALDTAHAGPRWMTGAVQAVRREGRIVAPVSTSVPAEVEELARDAWEWVGAVRIAASGLVPLRRRD